MPNALFYKFIEPYGLDPAQQGDLYLPDHPQSAFLVLFHGGFWRMPYDRSRFTPLVKV